jgi:hypothetical protein
METWKKVFFVMIVSVIFFSPSLVKASSVYNAEWDPPNVVVDAAHPYYFPILLPEWNLEKGDYSEATFDLTYLDQRHLNIYIYAADPATDTSNAANYNILLGTVPKAEHHAWGHKAKSHASGTAQFDLLATLSDADFDALFQDQSILYLVADCHYVFDKAVLHLEANKEATPVPVPGAAWLLASGLLGLSCFGPNVPLSVLTRHDSRFKYIFHKVSQEQT